MLACARLGACTRSCSAGSRRMSLRAGSRTRSQVSRDGVMRARAGPRRPVQASARPGHRPGRVEASGALRGASSGAHPAALVAGRESNGMTRWRAPCRRSAFRSRLPTRSTSSTRPVRPGSRGDRPRQRRPRRGAGVDDEEYLRRRPGEGTGGIGRRLGGRALVHRLPTALARLHDRALRRQAGGTPDPGASWRVMSDTASRRCSGTDGARAIRQQDPEGTQIRRYDLSRFRALSSPASAATRRRWAGP